jgi:hypothetical protein
MADFRARQEEKMRPICRVLTELTASYGPHFLRMTTGVIHGNVHVVVGDVDPAVKPRTELRFAITPKYELRTDSATSKSLYVQRPGFELSEAHFDPEFGISFDESSHSFSNASTLSEHIVKTVAEKIAMDRHLQRKTTQP